MDLIKKSLVVFSALLVIFSAKNSAHAQKSSSSSSNNISARAYFKKCQQYKDLWSSQNQISRQISHPRSNVNNLNTGVEKNKICRTYQCLRHNAELNLEKLRYLKCIDDNDCGTDISQMICTNYTRSSLTKYCSCPPGYAYNTNECKCMPAEICCTNSDSCLKGLKCQDSQCSCNNLETNVLYEIHGGFCVEARKTNCGLDIFGAAFSQSSTKDTAEVVVLSVLVAILILGLISLTIYIYTLRNEDLHFCAMGDYVCDHDNISPGNRPNQPHVAAWDAPGMDFLSEEQTLKYLNRSNSIEVTKSPSTATTAELVDEAPSPSGSLPECEQIKRVHESNFDNPVFEGSETKSDNFDDLEVL